MLSFGTLVVPQQKKFELKVNSKFERTKYEKFLIDSLKKRSIVESGYDMNQNGKIDYVVFYKLKNGKAGKYAYSVLKLKEEIDFSKFEEEAGYNFMGNKEKFFVDLDNNGTLERIIKIN